VIGFEANPVFPNCMNISRMKLVGVAVGIFAVTIWLHWPSTGGEFLDVDDKEYLRQSQQWNGLTWNAVKWAFTATDPYYHPLPRLSHVLDYQLFGTNAVGHHATSVVVHALNAALVFGFLWTLLGTVSVTIAERLAVSVGIAGAFAIHPFQVESVAWIAGRTQLLCATFGIGCLWAHVVVARRWVVWGLFTLALLCKPTAVSLPFVMLAMDYYPLRRHERLGWGKLLLEKAPMIALSVVVGTVTTVTEAELAPWGMAPLSDRVLMTFQSLVFYPWRLVYPWHLAPFYPLRLRPSLGEWKVVVSVLSVGVITALAVWSRRRRPALVAAWGAYIACVLPVSGLTQGLGAVAPRHAYVAMLPLLLVAGMGAVWLWRRLTAAVRPLLISSLACELCVFAVFTRSLIPEWHSEETLRRAVLTRFPDSEFDNRMLALTLLEQGRATEALGYAERAVQSAPEQSYAHMALGNALCRLGRLSEAGAEYEQAFRMNKDSALAHYNFGVGLMQLGNVPEAAEQFEQALQDKLNTPMAHYDLGYALYQMGRVPEAIKEFEVALQIWPNCAEAHNGLGSVLLRAGNVPDAIAHLEKALVINPDYAQAHYNLGIALAQAGREPEAMEHWEQAVKLKPDDIDAQYNLAIALQQQGRVTEAIAQFEQILKLRPDYTDARNALARLRAGQ
jgi:Flp pilus assembly protein TadD